LTPYLKPGYGHGWDGRVLGRAHGVVRVERLRKRTKISARAELYNLYSVYSSISKLSREFCFTFLFGRSIFLRIRPETLLVFYDTMLGFAAKASVVSLRGGERGTCLPPLFRSPLEVFCLDIFLIFGENLLTTRNMLRSRS